MRIVNPSYGQPAETDAANEAEAAARKPVDWSRDPIVLFANSKPNARELLEGVRDHLGSFRSIDNIDYVYKDSAAQPASPELIDQVAGKYRAALLAIAD